MNKQYYRLLLDDYSAASFTSFDKSYFGTLEQIDSLFFEHKADGKLREQLAEIISIYDRYIAGEKKITHNVAYREVPFLEPAKVIGTDTAVLADHVWQHFNTWNDPYQLKCAKAESKHIWFCCNRKYSRCIQTKFTDLQYESYIGKYEKLGEMLFGYPNQIIGDNGNLVNRLFVIEKTFKNRAEAMEDMAQFQKNKDINFAEILNDIFGDG